MIVWPNGTSSPPNFSAEGHFGWRTSAVPGASRYHRGLDMWGIGQVRAIADGEVVAVGWGPYGWGGGYQVWIQHDGFFTRSLHLVDGSSSLRVGNRVRAGQVIGTEGMTGAVQVHLHLEITPGQWHAYNSGQVDPKAWLTKHVTPGANVAGGGGTGGLPMSDVNKIMQKLEAIENQGSYTDKRTQRIEDRLIDTQKALGTRSNGASVAATLDAFNSILRDTRDTLVRVEKVLGERAEGDSFGATFDGITSIVRDSREILRRVETALGEAAGAPE